jgi:hypothetical protein
VHAVSGAPRFTLSDLGCTYIGQVGWERRRALYVPLGARVALLGWTDPALAGSFEHVTLHVRAVAWFNAVTWAEALTYVVGHPDEAAALLDPGTVEEWTTVLKSKPAYIEIGGGLFDG